MAATYEVVDLAIISTGSTGGVDIASTGDELIAEVGCPHITIAEVPAGWYGFD
ncbi:unnamed protein product [marine sediment metagenome]|uniref:Uncharacterized protein n=1 Tax=marine sediment metagenome TaxID=412755 RepID=X1E0U2_9ZZZZ